MRHTMPLNPSAGFSPTRWHLRIVLLLLGIIILHVWAGPALSTTDSAPVPPATTTTVVQETITPPAAQIPAAVPQSGSSTLEMQNVGQVTRLGDVCAAACPDGHMVATALCSLVLIAAGLIGLYCLRAMFFLHWGNRERQAVQVAPVSLHAGEVSLLHLSISRT